MAFGFKKAIRKYKVLQRYGRFDEEALLIAAEDGNETCLSILLGEKFDINFKGRNNHTALHRAVINNRLSCIKLLLENGANADLQDHVGKTPLMYTIENGDKHLFDLLLEQYPDLEIRDQMGETVLFHAIRSNETSIARKLIEKGANVDHQNVKGESPLMVAVESEKVGIVKSLLQHDADPTLLDENDQSVLEHNIPSLRIKRLLQKASVHHKIGEHEDHLNLASNLISDEMELIPIANGLLNQFPRLSALLIGLADGIYANLNEQYNLQGLEKKGKEVIDQLENLAENSIQDIRSNGNGTSKGKKKPNITNQADLDKALLEAVQKDTYHLSELLLKLGANPNYRDENGKTSLHFARNNKNMVQVLIQHKADPWLEDKDGESPYLIAQKNNWTTVLSLMKKV